MPKHNNIRDLPVPEPYFRHTEDTNPIIIHRWSVGYSKRTSHRTLLLYRELEFGGGLGGGGESLRYLPPSSKEKK